jgi:8-oxo-dGTP pyrophosphatase MutT (NUDIX family)
MAPVPRVGARLLLVDPADRVVLIEERLDLSEPASEWLIPGGGVEAGETPVQAAVRETYEETGIAVPLADLTELYTYRRLWTDVERGVQYDQLEHIYFARLTSAQRAVPVALTDDERPYVIGPRWWTLDDLRASDARFEPADVAERVTGVLATPRVAGRVLLLDEDDRVLLIENHVDVGTSATHWITPGGGMDPGETPAQAAMREAYEELRVRIELSVDAEPDYSDNEVFTFNGRWYDQTNHYFLARLPAGARLEAGGVDELERSLVIGERWWTAAELRASSVTIYPMGLADVLQRLLCDERVASA